MNIFKGIEMNSWVGMVMIWEVCGCEQVGGVWQLSGRSMGLNR